MINTCKKNKFNKERSSHYIWLHLDQGGVLLRQIFYDETVFDGFPFLQNSKLPHISSLTRLNLSASCGGRCLN